MPWRVDSDTTFMANKSIVNIINFIRGVEPRNPSADLAGTLEKEILLVQEHGLPATWLIQYDALIDERFRTVIKTLDGKQEIGAWFEVVQAQVEKAGLTWRGRPGYSWDWHANVGFSAGYTPSERELLADVIMDEFHSTFGQYPASVGSWFMDAHLIGYLHDKYGVIASCNCRDQWGTDGYTMWGGYYSGAYYPSRKNAFVPAQNEDNQIPVPIFRMLGSDPIYQYDAPDSGNGQLVFTLEPSCETGGSSPDWVRWFFDTTLKSPSLTFGYAQVGQENSFGWDAMQKGLTDQISLLSEIAKRGEARVETLQTSAEWYRSTYKVTPASAVTALSDWKNEGRSSVWYNSRFYRVNLFWEDDKFSIRDIRVFNEEYKERYLTSTCTTEASVYDTLPAMDGVFWSDAESKASIHPVELLSNGEAKELPSGPPSAEEDGDTLQIAWRSRPGVDIYITCAPESFSIKVTGCSKWALHMNWGASKEVPIEKIEPQKISYRYEDFTYEMKSLCGKFERGEDEHSLMILPSEGEVCLGF